MDTIEQLIKDGTSFFDRIILDGDPDWQSEADNIPDDEYPEEGAPSTTVAASESMDEQPATLAKLSAAVLEGLTGVSYEWLSPVRPAFERLAALAMSPHVTDDDFLAALEKAQREMPELFDRLNTDALKTAFADAIGSAMLAGSVSTFE